MNYAIIDIGSNSIRLSVYRYEQGVIEPLLHKREMVGLADYVQNGALQAAGIDKACEVLKSYQAILPMFRLQSVHVFATASLRNVSNTGEALRRICAQTGLNVEIISGETEAELDFRGATYAVPVETGALIDIGGGSTELVAFTAGAAHFLKSIPLGSLNLHTQFVEGVLPAEKERESVREAIDTHFAADDIQKSGPKERMIGVGGTVRAAFKLAREWFGGEFENVMPASHVSAMVDKLKYNDPEPYRTVSRVIPERTAIILTGLMVLQKAIEVYRCQWLHLSKFGVREGYLLRLAGQETAPGDGNGQG